MKARALPTGPEGQQNWQAHRSGAAWRWGAEHHVYSDCYFTGTIPEGLGPYQFLNLVPFGGSRAAASPVLALRLQYHLGASEHPSLERTDDRRFHGGTLAEEMTALLCLELGVRLKCGGQTRDYYKPGEPGSPRAERPDQAPALHVRLDGTVLPGKRRRCAVAEDRGGRLERYPDLAAEDAVALVRAARLYQQALWHADADPSHAWVLLVSAVEAAADRAAATRGPTPDGDIAALEEWNSGLASALRQACPDVLAEVARQLRPVTGSTRKFAEFVLKHAPAPPERRPPTLLRFDWPDLHTALKKIYHHRSRALHEGTPFPVPTCSAPLVLDGWDAPAEIPEGVAAASHGSTWVRSDTPMLLHTFEHICHRSLLSWWDSLLAADRLAREP